MHTPSRRSCSAGRTAPEPSRAAVPPPTQLTHCEVPQRRQTSGGLVPHPHCTRGLVGGPTRGLLLTASSRAATHGGAALGAAPAPSPPSSPSRAQRVPPRIWGESALPDTMVMDSLAGDTASSSGACVPAARNGRAGKKQNPAPPALSRRCRNISGELNANKPTLLQTHFPHAILTFTPPHHHHSHHHLLLYHCTYLGAP